jgi:hypothetical protein
MNREMAGEGQCSASGRPGRRLACGQTAGADAGNIDVPDLDTLQVALNRADERHNMTRFTPVGYARDLAVTALRQVIDALAGRDSTQAAAILAHVQPDSPDNTARAHRRRMHRRRPRPPRRLAIRRPPARPS